MTPDPYIAWVYQDQPRTLFPRYVVVHSTEISESERVRADELFDADQVTDDFTPIVFLDESLDTPELRSRIQAEAVARRKPPAQ